MAASVQVRMSSGNTSALISDTNNTRLRASSDRVSQFSYVRVVACFAIVLLHCFNSARVYHAETISAAETTFARAACAALMWAVPCFLMVTGALLLDRERVITARKLFGKYIRRVLTALIVFTAIFTLIKHGTSSMEGFGGEFLDGLLYNHCMAYLWYLYLMIALYLLMPLFKIVVDRLSDKQLGWLAALLLIVCSVLPLASYLGVGEALFIPTQIVYGVYLLLGFLLYRHRMDARIAAALFVICTVALPIITRTLLQTDIDPSGLTGYNSPLVVLQSASAYSLMLRIKRPAKGLIEDLDRCTFGIYLIHMIFIRMLMCEMGFDPFDLGVGCFIALAVIFYFTSANITYVLKKVRIFDFL